MLDVSHHGRCRSNTKQVARQLMSKVVAKRLLPGAVQPDPWQVRCPPTGVSTLPANQVAAKQANNSEPPIALHPGQEQLSLDTTKVRK